jgi:hypothetical protein
MCSIDFKNNQGGRLVRKQELKIHQTFQRLLYIIVVIGSDVDSVCRVDLNF